MDQQQQHENEAMAPFAFYQPDDAYNAIPYAPQPHMGYPVVPSSQTPEMLQMRQLSLLPHHAPSFQYPASPTQVAADMQLPPSPSPVDSNSVYDHPISPPVSGSDTSTDGSSYHTPHTSHSFSRESSSPPSVRRNHGQHRYNPTSGRHRRRSSTNDEGDISDEEQSLHSIPQMLQGQALAEQLSNSRKEATRRQRIEAEQRRRDELREGYAKLKNVLPLTNQKSSKVSLLERATNHIKEIDQTNKILNGRIAALEAQVSRLREANERLSITVSRYTGEMPADHLADLGYSQNTYEEQHSQEQLDTRPLSPPPDIQPQATTPQAIPHAEPSIVHPQVPSQQQQGLHGLPPPPPSQQHLVHPHVQPQPLTHQHHHSQLTYHHRNDSASSQSGGEY